jgi:hypothetical protein
MKTVTLVLLILLNSFAYGAENTCSRTAIINHQEILVDTNSTDRGEGLRPYLEKDKVAKSYLDLYQDNSKVRWHSAALGTLGALTIISSFFTSSSESRRSLMIAGASLMTINFFTAKTLENSNEANLRKAVEEYNKRNIPRIHFDPNHKSDIEKDSPGLTFQLQKSWSF